MCVLRSQKIAVFQNVAYKNMGDKGMKLAYELNYTQKGHCVLYNSKD